MRAAIYNPYLDTLGGGERYTMAFANVLVNKGYGVDVEWKDPKIKLKLEERFGIKLSGINFINDIKRGDGYDLTFWVSDGSIPLLRARNNILHFQVPFKNVNGKSLLNRMKFFRISKIVCNSKFTKNIIDKEYGVKSIVVYPPVDTDKIKPKRKENLIIAIGRFSQLTQAKRQDVLIKAFKKLSKKYSEWNLILAGGSEVGAEFFLKKINKMIKGFRIQIIEKPGFDQIKDLYGRAKIFWSASGYGVDEVKEPKSIEHFGITVVEAMAAGCIPIVFNAGGHTEIVTDQINGFLWSKKSELLTKTLKIINNSKSARELSRKALKSSKMFGYEKFEKEVSAII